MLFFNTSNRHPEIILLHVPNRVVKESAASRNSVVEIALSLAASTGTSENDFFMVSIQVPPGGITGAEVIL